MSKKPELNEAELRRILSVVDNNVTLTAKYFQVSRKTIYAHMRLYGFAFERMTYRDLLKKVRRKSK